MFEYEVIDIDNNVTQYVADQVWSEGQTVSLLIDSKSNTRKYDVVAVFNVATIKSVQKVI